VYLDNVPKSLECTHGVNARSGQLSNCGYAMTKIPTDPTPEQYIYILYLRDRTIMNASVSTALVNAIKPVAPRRPSKRFSRSTRSVVSAQASASDLQAKFGIDGSVDIVEGRGGLTTVVLKHACGSSADVVLFGGCVTSWKQSSGDEVLYIRPDAKFDGSKPISGGIPHCFPQFGPGEMQQHGFARNLEWEISSTSADPNPDNPDPEVQLVLTQNEYTKNMWPHDFMVAYTVRLHGEDLVTDMRVMNMNSADSFSFNGALHTYFEVAGIENAKVNGLKGLTFLDKTADPENPAKGVEERESLSFSGPVDSVYLSSSGHVSLDVGTGAAVSIDSTNWNDTVVWSPWTAMEECYKEFCCVENAQFEPVTLKPGETWRGTTTMRVVDL
jgi:glucose-6-phosphate 1-epimerase